MAGNGVDLLCLGEGLVEFNQGAPGGAYLQGFGGDVSNVAVAAARLGLDVGMVSAVGGDAFGDLLLEMWRAEGVSHTHVRRFEERPTGLYFVTHGPEGHAFTYRRTGSAASRYGPGDLPRAALHATRALHVSAISQAISPSACDAVFAAIDMVRAAGGLVSYDTNLRLELWPVARARAIVQASVAQADTVLPGLEDARRLTGLEAPEAIAERFLELGAGCVALTLGPGGALFADASGVTHVAPHRVEVVDATGAGDAFDGAFLAAWLNGADGPSATRFANAAAALSVRGYGAVAPLPQRAAVETLLASVGEESL